MTYTIRRLNAEDLDIYQDHLIGLDKNSRQARFEAALCDSSIIKYTKWLLKDDGYLYGAFDSDKLIAVGELRPLPDKEGKTHAEAALSVDRDYRKKGLATLLFHRLRHCAFEHSISIIDLVTLPDNFGIRKMAKKFGMPLKFSGGVLTGELRSKEIE